jgi:hypothetical protein
VIAMMIKGKNRHVMPDGSQGWWVVDEANRLARERFGSLDEALDYASRDANWYECRVLVHESPVAQDKLPSPASPQRQFNAPATCETNGTDQN